MTAPLTFAPQAYPGGRKRVERYWLDEWDPAELERRAVDMERDGHLGIAQQFRDRASLLRKLRDEGLQKRPRGGAAHVARAKEAQGERG